MKDEDYRIMRRDKTRSVRSRASKCENRGYFEFRIIFSQSDGSMAGEIKLCTCLLK